MNNFLMLLKKNAFQCLDFLRVAENTSMNQLKLIQQLVEIDPAISLN